MFNLNVSSMLMIYVQDIFDRNDNFMYFPRIEQGFAIFCYALRKSTYLFLDMIFVVKVL